MEAFHQALRFGIGRLADDHLRRQRAAERLTFSGNSMRRARHRPIAPSPSHTNTLGTAPSWVISCHQPAYRSCASREGINTAEANLE